VKFAVKEIQKIFQLFMNLSNTTIKRLKNNKNQRGIYFKFTFRLSSLEEYFEKEK